MFKIYDVAYSSGITETSVSPLYVAKLFTDTMAAKWG